MLEELLFQAGYAGLFIISLLAASLLPLISELFVVGMIPLGYDIWLIVAVATAGNFAGALVNYYVGLRGSEFMLARFVKIKEETWARAERFFSRWGPVVLFFSWVPIIGDPLTAVAGAFRLDLRVFSFWVILGKGLRYLFLLGLTAQFLPL